ncbi:nuclear envelope pore membrane protein POM 121-like [Littorina saxatilis]|uniref:nuclear envelope pore membrane protein POM 121-like n=1 Tax=Littorina saxatilis TaxID=31220 RepID=UPI0038B5E30F
MWKNWFPFRRKEDKKESSVLPTETQKIEKENGSKHDAIQFPARNANVTEVSGRRPVLDRAKVPDPIPGSTPRSPFTRRVSYIESNDCNRQDYVPPKHSVMNPSGPLLSTPLLPKIKRAIEFNDSFSGRNSSPLTRSRVARSASLSFGPTHPTRSTPGRLPVVRLQRRQSVHLINRGNMQSPSTVKVAPPDPHLLSGPSFRVSPAPSVSPVKAPMVDTETVVSALRERSCRKRTTTAVTEDSVVEDEHTQMAKRRRQDSNLSTSSSISMPSMPDILTDLSKQQDPFTTLQHIEQMAVKRPSAPRQRSFDDISAESPLPKRERRNNSSRILSSLSSSARAAEHSQRKTTEQPPVNESGKRTRSDSTVTNRESTQPSKKLYPDLSAKTASESSKRVPTLPSTATSSIGTPVVAQANDPSASKPMPDKQEPQASTPKRKIMLNVLEQAGRPRSNIYPSLARQATKPVMMASPADLELDRKAEDQRRVQDMLSFLDEDEDSKTVLADNMF